MECNIVKRRKHQWHMAGLTYIILISMSLGHRDENNGINRYVNFTSRLAGRR